MQKNGLIAVPICCYLMHITRRTRGTGEVFDWSCLDEFERPFMLAGGIDSTNVARAIRTVRPYGIDISSGIETKA